MKLLLVFFICLSVEMHSQNISFSAGILRSDIVSYSDFYRQGNTPKYGFWTTAGVDFKLRKHIAIETNLTYQERKPLEVFPFEGIGFWKYPTSKQSPGYRPEFPIFPNFKYLHLELVPVFENGHKLKTQIGVGFFYGVLINRDETTRGQSDFPLEQDFFGPPFYTHGEIFYHRQDYGFLPKASLTYQVNSRLGIGINVKSYQSIVRLNDTNIYSSLPWNARWSAVFGGVECMVKL